MPARRSTDQHGWTASIVAAGALTIFTCGFASALAIDQPQPELRFVKCQPETLPPETLPPVTVKQSRTPSAVRFHAPEEK